MIARTAAVRIALLASLVVVAGCGSSPSASFSPSSPSPLPTGSGGATIAGSVSGASGASGGLHTESTGLTIAITGTGISATVSSGGSFTLNGVPSGDVELHITNTGLDARLTIAAVSNGEMIHIVINVNGSQAGIIITDRQKPDHTAELEGLIASLNLSARTIVVGTRPVSVPLDVTIRHGNTSFSLTDLRIGDRVHVRGMLNGDVLIASEIKLQNPGDD